MFQKIFTHKFNNAKNETSVNIWTCLLHHIKLLLGSSYQLVRER